MTTALPIIETFLEGQGLTFEKEGNTVTLKHNGDILTVKEDEGMLELKFEAMTSTAIPPFVSEESITKAAESTRPEMPATRIIAENRNIIVTMQRPSAGFTGMDLPMFIGASLQTVENVLANMVESMSKPSSQN